MHGQRRRHEANKTTSTPKAASTKRRPITKRAQKSKQQNTSSGTNGGKDRHAELFCIDRKRYQISNSTKKSGSYDVPRGTGRETPVSLLSKEPQQASNLNLGGRSCCFSCRSHRRRHGSTIRSVGLLKQTSPKQVITKSCHFFHTLTPLTLPLCTTRPSRIRSMFICWLFGGGLPSHGV